MIITSGYNIYPSQIEEVINMVNGVAISCVIGVEDRSVGQRVVAVVQPVNYNGNLDELRNRILEKCEENIAKYAMPQEIIFKETIPRSVMGKIDFKALSKELYNKEN